jgi:pyruvate formate lyase activating enzyme
MMRIISDDAAYYGENGGVTFSGGEPLFQDTFLFALLDECTKLKIHTVLETNMNASGAVTEKAAGLCDIIYCDFKALSDSVHIEYTGVSNIQIIENIKKLHKFAKEYHIRTPVVAGVNDNAEEIVKMAEFAAGLKNLSSYELLSCTYNIPSNGFYSYWKHIGFY